MYGGSNTEEMLVRMEEVLSDWTSRHPGADVKHQLFDNEHPLLVAIVTPMMHRICIMVRIYPFREWS